MTREVPVQGDIRLGQFLKLAGLAENGAHARFLIQEGDVSVDGQVETRRGHHLKGGATVEVRGPSGTDSAIVGNA